MTLRAAAASPSPYRRLDPRRFIGTSRSFRQHIQQQVECRGAEGAHVGDAVRATGFERDRPLGRSGHGDAAVAGRIAISIAARPGRSALGQGPARREALPRGLRQQPRIGLGRGAHAERSNIRKIQQGSPGNLGIDDGATEKVGGRAGQGQQRRRNAGRRSRIPPPRWSRPGPSGDARPSRRVRSIPALHSSPSFAVTGRCANLPVPTRRAYDARKRARARSPRR